MTGPPPTKARLRAATVAIWLLVLASIVLLPDAFVRWFLPKDLVAAAAVAIASVAVARGRLPRWFVLASLGAGLIALLAVLFSAAPGAQLWGRWPRYEGLITLPVYFGAVWAGARLLGPAAPAGQLRTVVRAVAAAALALGMVSLLEAAGARPLASDLARPGALTGNATDQGVLAALFVAVLALPVLRAWTPSRGVGRSGTPGATSAFERWALSAALLLAALTVVLSASRAGLLAAGVTVVVLLVLEIVRGDRVAARRTAVIGASAAVLLAAGTLLVPFTRNRVLGASPLAAQSFEGRFDFWRDSLALLAAHPFGLGPSGFLNEYSGVSTATDSSTLDSPHNWLFQVALAGGVPLVMLVLGIVIAGVWGGVRGWRRACLAAAHLTAANLTATDAARPDLQAAALAGLAGFGVALLTHFTAPSTTIVAAALAGVLLAAGPTGGARARLATAANAGLARGTRTAALTAWTVALLMAMSAEVPLNAGVTAAARGQIAAADAAFDHARSLRPWDTDLESIAAQSFAAASDAASAAASTAGPATPEGAAAAAGAADAGQLAVEWAQRSRADLPGTVATERALAVGQLAVGDSAGAARTLAVLVRLAPGDPAIAVQNAIVLYTVGDISGTAAEVQRALRLDPQNETALRLQQILFAE
ncbi:O-antigen ligase family protein [Cryobacterium melibiosiphilum]|nr:O-antigen ligase family protein [Cryobacterium melibiosiphilum]